jgi:hypothetical protein
MLNPKNTIYGNKNKGNLNNGPKGRCGQIISNQFSYIGLVFQRTAKDEENAQNTAH